MSAHHRESPQEPLELRPEQGQKLSVVLLALAGGGTALSLVGLATDSTQFFFSYLTAFSFVIQVLLGCLFWVLLHHLVDAGWSVVVRRVAENYSWVLIFAGLLVLPILAGMGSLYDWTHDHPGDELLAGKRAFLNPTFFIIRNLVYFAVWAWLAWKMVTWSKQQDQSHDPALTRRMQALSAPGMILLGLTAAFAGIDWLMTLDYKWSSTMFGVYFWAGAILSSMAAITLTVVLMRRAGFLQHSITPEHLHDLGKLTFAFVIFWAYITFSQYFLIWYAAIPEETIYFSNRRWIAPHGLRELGSWHWLGVFIVFAHVVIPFLVLLPRQSKRNPLILGTMAAWLLVVHFVELHWQVMPVYHKEGFSPSWIDLATLAAVVGAAGILVLRTFKATALLPRGDPRLQESLSFQNV
jgi:hypothetical protein